jgi:hypothetical protein
MDILNDLLVIDEEEVVQIAAVNKRPIDFKDSASEKESLSTSLIPIPQVRKLGQCE